MAFDKRQNLKISTLSTEDAKDSSKIAQWTADVALKLNQLKSPRFAVRTLRYQYNQDSTGQAPLVKLEDIGFVPGAVVLGAVNGLSKGVPSVLDPAPGAQFFLTRVQANGTTLQFALRDGSGTPVSAYSGQMLQVIVIIFERDSINPTAANSQFNQTFKVITGT